MFVALPCLIAVLYDQLPDWLFFRMLVQERLGAVACLQLALNHFAIHDDVIVIGGYGILCFPSINFLNSFEDFVLEYFSLRGRELASDDKSSEFQQ